MEQNKINERIAILENQNIQTNIIVEKLENTIDKLSDVSAALKEMIALNSHKLAQAEADIEKNTLEIKNNEDEHDKRINELKQLIAVVSNTLDSHLQKENTTSVEQSKALTEIKASLTNMNDRIGALEKWRWLIVGGAGVVYFIFTFGTKMLFENYSIQQTPQTQQIRPTLQNIPPNINPPSNSSP